MIFFVSQYDVTRHYGGPEEGGWWYDRREFKEVVAEVRTIEELTSKNNPATAIRRSLSRLSTRLNLQPGPHYQGRYSVANPTDICFIVESEPGERDNTDEPQYYC